MAQRSRQGNQVLETSDLESRKHSTLENMPKQARGEAFEGQNEGALAVGLVNPRKTQESDSVKNRIKLHGQVVSRPMSVLDAAIWTTIDLKMREGISGLRSRWFSDADCKRVFRHVKHKLLTALGTGILSPTRGGDRANELYPPGPITKEAIENYVYAMVHRDCLEILRKREKPKLRGVVEIDFSKFAWLAKYVHRRLLGAHEPLSPDKEFKEILADIDKRAERLQKAGRLKELEGLKYFRGQLLRISGPAGDVIQDTWVEFLKKVRSGEWRGDFGNASIGTFLKETANRKIKSLWSRKEKELGHRVFDWTAPKPEHKEEIEPGVPDPHEKGRPSGFFGDHLKKISPEAAADWKFHRPNFVSDCWGKCSGEPRQDHWLDDVKVPLTRADGGLSYLKYGKIEDSGGGIIGERKHRLPFGIPVIIVEERKFRAWWLSHYGKYPEQAAQRRELYRKLFCVDEDEINPNLSYKELLRRVPALKKFTSILYQRYGEGWKFKEIARVWPGHSENKVRSIIEYQKQLFADEVRRHGYLRK